MGFYESTSSTNWSTLFDENQYDTQHFSLEFSIKTSNSLLCGWGELISIVRNELMSRASHHWSSELKALRKILIQRFNIGPFKLNEFDDNFALFTHFIYCSFNQSDIAPKLSTESRQLNVDNDAHRLHAQHMFEYLLRHHIGSMIATTNLETLLERAGEIKGLSALVMPNTAPTLAPPPALSIWASLQAWLLNLFLYLKHILSGKIKADKPELYAELANNLWCLLQVCQIDMQTLVEGTAVHALLYQAYQNSINHLSQAPLQVETYFKQHRTIVETKTKIHFFNTNSIETLKNIIQSDLKTLTQWANSHFQCAILKFQTNPQQGLADYLNAYQVTQQRLNSLSAELYVFRMDVEYYLRPTPDTKAKKAAHFFNIDIEGFLGLRNPDSKLKKVGRFINVDIKRSIGLNSTKDYFELLHALDNALRTIHTQFITTNIEWLEEAKRWAPHTEIEKASNYLLTLLSPSIQALEHNIRWVAHTAYSPDRTEAKIAYEIEQLNVTPIPYHLKTAYTQTDYLINNSLPQSLRTARNEMLKVDTNRLQTEPLLLPIANFGTQVIDNLIKKARALTRAWRLSQWFDPSIDPNIEPALIDEDPLVANIVDAPTEALTLGVFVLHQDYMNWIKTQPIITKSCQSVRIQDQLYDGPDEIFQIALLQHTKARYPRVQADIARLAEEREALLGEAKDADTLIQELDTVIQEKDTVIHEKDTVIHEKDTVIHEKDTVIQEKDTVIQTALSKFILRELKAGWSSVNAHPNRNAALDELKNNVFMSTSEVFPVTREEFLVIANDCITNHLLKQATAAPSVTKNPAGMYTNRPPEATALPEAQTPQENTTASHKAAI